MRRANIYLHGNLAGVLEETERNEKYRFRYHEDYAGPPISHTMPVSSDPYTFDGFPPFFDGLLPEGEMLDGLLRQAKLDSNDYLGQLVVVGGDLVGAVTVREAK